MLVLSRKVNEIVRITVPPSAVPQVIDVLVVAIGADKSRLGFTADPVVQINRIEIQNKIDTATGK